MTVLTVDRQVLGPLVTIVLVAVVMDVQPHVLLSAYLASVPGPSQGGEPSRLPLVGKPVLAEGHLSEPRRPRLQGKPPQTLPLIVDLESYAGAGLAQQFRSP
jgi:hypothetical protein